MRDLKYAKLLIDPSYHSLESRVSTDSIHDAVRVYVSNMDSVVSLIRLPPHMVYWSQYIQLFETEARYRRARRFVKVDTDPIDKQIEDAIVQEVGDRLRRHKEAFLNESLVARTAWDRGTHNMSAFNEEFDDFFAPGIEAVFFATITGTWTAFEILVSDLWETVVNSRPRLGFVAIEAEPAPENTEEVRERKTRAKFSIPVRLLRKFDYNLKNRMGTLLRGKWHFDRRNEAFDAYKKVFGRESIDALDTIFNDKCVKWIAATRNAIVHRGGIADGEFGTLTDDHPKLSKFEESSRIELDGELVRELVDPVIGRSIALVEFVVDWMARNKE